jgi:hypothetical protein
MAEGVFQPGVFQPGVFLGVSEVVPTPTPEPGLVSVTLVFAGPEVTAGATPFGGPNLLELVQS